MFKKMLRQFLRSTVYPFFPTPVCLKTSGGSVQNHQNPARSIILFTPVFPREITHASLHLALAHAVGLDRSVQPTVPVGW